MPPISPTIKGMIPIAKNIIVVDENGFDYEATFPKRAKGLVKKGRARFISENKICLACPPNKNLEEDIMDNNIDGKQEKQTTVPTIEYVLERIDKIMNDIAYIREAIESVKDMEASATDFTRAEAIARIVNAREGTNQQLLRLLEKMYADLKPEKVSNEILKFRELSDALCRFPPDVAEDILSDAVQQMFVKPGTPENK